METENIYIHLLGHLVKHYNIKIKFISYIVFGKEYKILLNEYTNVVEIGLTSHEHAFKTLRKIESFRGYDIKIVYLGEYTEQKPGKSWLCKRTPKELEDYYRSSNPCHGCELDQCEVDNCIALKILNK